MSTNDIIGTIQQLKANGAEFLTVPDSYYEELPGRVGDIEEEIPALQKLGILVDRDDSGYLLQLFTKPVQDRPTLFFELIQRKNARSFGKGNFKALFESIEREQARTRDYTIRSTATMPIYIQRGKIPHRRHTVFKSPQGNHYFEEHISRLGFSDIYSNVYHIYMPTRVVKVGKFRPVTLEALEGEHRHRT